MESRVTLCWQYPHCYNWWCGIKPFAWARTQAPHAGPTTATLRPQKLNDTSAILHPVWRHLSPTQQHQLHLLLSQLLTRRLPPPPAPKEAGHEQP
jgi:hypothetical protein